MKKEAHVRKLGAVFQVRDINFVLAAESFELGDQAILAFGGCFGFFPSHQLSFFFGVLLGRSLGGRHESDLVGSFGAGESLGGGLVGLLVAFGSLGGRLHGVGEKLGKGTEVLLCCVMLCFVSLLCRE